MKNARIHCDVAEKPSADRGSVEKPPVGIVENALARAWYGVISSSMPEPADRRKQKHLHDGEPDVEEPELSRRGANALRKLGDLGPG